MAIPLPNLDDRTYADLVDEARALLPSLAPEWTNHNPSDPGITLVELFAWLTEMLIWRTNQVPADNVVAFLRLLNGPGWEPSGSLDDDVRAAVSGLRDDQRAVTPADYERLSTDAFNRFVADARAAEAAGAPLAEWRRVTRLDPAAGGLPSRVSPLARARCVPRRYLGAGTEAERAADHPGRVSVLVIPGREGPPPGPLAGAPPPLADGLTRRALGGFLDERRMLATRVDVGTPRYVPVRVEVVLVRQADAADPVPAATLRERWAQVPNSDVRKGVLSAVAGWLDPLVGGAAGRGWPFGRDVHVSDLYGVIEAVHGVDYVYEVRLSSACPHDDPDCVSADEVWHEGTGEQVGLALSAHHLPRAALAAEDVHVAAALLPVAVRVSLRPSRGTAPAALRKAVRETVRRAFHPGHGGPTGAQTATVTAASIRLALRDRAEVDARQAVQVRLAADPARVVHPDDPERQGVKVEPRELAGPSLELFTDGRALWP